MACFLACFGGSKSRKARSLVPKNLSRNTNHEHNESSIPLCPLIVPIKSPAEEIHEISFLKTREETTKEEHSNGLNPMHQKRACFDLQSKTCSKIPSEDVSISTSKKHIADHETKEKEVSHSTQTRGDRIAGSFPSSHRYQNCGESDEENIDDPTDDDCVNDEDEVDGNNIGVDRGVTFESYYYTSSIEPDAKDISPPSIEKEVEPATNQRPAVTVECAQNLCLLTVLNPVANVSEGKSLKIREPPLLKEIEKENISHTGGRRNQSSTASREQMNVEASLSNWLIPCHTVNEVNSTSISDAGFSKKSKKGAKRRAVLGVLTNKQIHRTPPRMLSPCKSPGGNWDNNKIPAMDDDCVAKFCSDIKGIPNTTSKYREDRQVKWHSTPFEVRLERALCKERFS